MVQRQKPQGYSPTRIESGGGDGENRRSNDNDDALSSSSSSMMSPLGGPASAACSGRSSSRNRTRTDHNDEQNHHQQQLPEQLQQYAAFVDQTLKPELQIVENAAREVQKEIDDYEELAEKIQQRQQQQQQQHEHEHETMMVDLGYGKVRCHARPCTRSSPSFLRTDDGEGTTTTSSTTQMMVFVDVGLGFHVELSEGEAIDFCKRRMEFLSTHKLKRYQQKMVEIKDHILSASNILNELQNEMTSAH